MNVRQYNAAYSRLVKKLEKERCSLEEKLLAEKDANKAFGFLYKHYLSQDIIERIEDDARGAVNEWRSNHDDNPFLSIEVLEALYNLEKPLHFLIDECKSLYINAYSPYGFLLDSIERNNLFSEDWCELGDLLSIAYDKLLLKEEDCA